MKIPKQCKIHLAAATEIGRYSMHAVRHVAGWIEATNGKILARVRVTDDEDDTDGVLMPANLVKAALSKPRVTEAQIEANGHVWAQAKDGAIGSDPVDGEFPRVDAVIPDVSDIVHVGFNVKLLLDLARAIGCEDGVVMLQLDRELLAKQDGRGYRQPIRIDSPHGHGVLMPVTKED